MLKLIEDETGKHMAQAQFDRLLRKTLRKTETRDVVWRPDRRTLPVAHDDEWWYASVAPSQKQNTPRYWNSIGRYKEGNGGLIITVEINIAVNTNSRQVSGFYARDDVTGITYLMHDGGVGGGKPGVGQEAFLAWSGAELVPVYETSGKVRLGIVVAPLSAKLGRHVIRFARLVADFKRDVRSDDIDVEAIRLATSRLKDYKREFSGYKKGVRAREVEYETRHGDVVHAVALWREGRLKPESRLQKNTYVDLAISTKGHLQEIYEVKTSTRRQALYTAIGQILVHQSAALRVRRVLVVPDEGEISNDIQEALSRLKIHLMKYRLGSDDSVDFPI